MPHDSEEERREPLVRNSLPLFEDEAEWRGEMFAGGRENLSSSSSESVHIIMGPLFDIHYLQIEKNDYTKQRGVIWGHMRYTVK